ncbi:protein DETOXIFICATION 14-like [Andrographis paniculata]|uniref:protein DETOXIFICATION 14-like n=1 Tax=Andrographis paniculata TaxID=175694 RepID=UPI0021E83F7C|nr:protein DETOXIFICATION 14-like [Andrographis paniculata]
MESEEPLIVPKTELRSGGFAARREAYVGELRRATTLALPIVVVSLTQYLLRAASMMMLGHLGELAFAGASISTSLCNVTGYSLLLGMASALETLCGQAYGAENYHKVGIFTYGAVLWLFLACLPISLLWVYTEKLLILIGQDPMISKEAGIFSIWLIPTLVPYAILQPMTRYLQIQSLIMPMVWSSILSLVIHLPLSWVFIFTLKLGSPGAAIVLCFSYWLNVIVLGIYIKWSPSCKKTHASFSKDIFLTFGEFFCFAIPSALMVCLEWWTYEIVVLLGGLLTNPGLETSVLSVCLTITSMHYLIQYSLGAAASTRISNELGAGKPEAAKRVLTVMLFLSVVEITMADAILFFFRSDLGFAFSNEESMVGYVKRMTPILCISIIMDSLQAVLSGAARGTGWQHIGAYINLGSYYLAGIPISLLLGFYLGLKGEGLWGGLVVGSTVQTVLLGVVALRTDWHKQAVEARERMMIEGKISTYNEDEVV